MKSIDLLRKNTRNNVNEVKELFGYNLAALLFLKREVEVNSNVKFFGEQTNDWNLKHRTKKRKMVL